jgi:hypothetical protein
MWPFDCSQSFDVMSYDKVETETQLYEKLLLFIQNLEHKSCHWL